MLVLSRKPGEKVRIGSDITLTILELHGNRVRVGIDAPSRVPVMRDELCDPLAELLLISKETCHAAANT
jgi:carbon storage regulator